MKKVYIGLESSGKSLALAMEADKIRRRNARWLKKSGIARPIVSNIDFSKDFKAKCEASGIPLHIWENLDDLIKFTNCDVFIDEIGTYFDARNWAELSLDVRRWAQQGAKSGVEMYCAAQDFAQVDISFRRLVNQVYQISKILGSPRPSNTRPPVKHIWGLCIKWELDARSYKATDAEMQKAWMLPSFFLIERRYCELFDTTQFLKRSKPAEFKHSLRICPDCGFEKIFHS